MVMSCENEKFNPQNLSNGNVLFLILIVVALFGALYFAVSQSSYISAGSQGNESGNIKAAQINIFPTVVRSQILRMIAQNTALENLEFNPPSDFSSLSNPDIGVFHPSRGTPYSRADPDVMANEQQGEWYFNRHFEIANIGSSSAGNIDGNDIVAFLPGIKQNICLRANQENAVDTIPSISDSGYLTDAMELLDSSYLPPAGENDIGDSVLTELAGKQFGCFEEQNTGTYIYYFALIEL